MKLLVIIVQSIILQIENCLFGSVKLTKNADIDKYGYYGYGIGFDRNTSFSLGNEIGKKCNNFWS